MPPVNPSVKLPDQAASEADFPDVAQLLVSGGDARIELDPVSGMNKYGCKPYPNPQLLAFGSSTASSISQEGFEAVSLLRDRLRLEAQSVSLDGICMSQMQRISGELLALTQLADLDINLILAASGTDAHHLVAGYLARISPLPLHVLMVEEAETGSGVAAALSVPGVLCTPFDLRAADGTPRPLAQIDAEVTALVSRLISQGQRVLLIMVDQSKTGLIAPSPACAMQLYQRYQGSLSVLVDACQFRISSGMLRAYLKQGFMVALTGSKFLAGSSFSAALLLPSGAPSLHSDCSPGLLLRWEAALVELRRFCAVPEDTVMRYLNEFAQAVHDRLANDPCFEALAVPAPDRHALHALSGWDDVQTIFPFLLYRANAGGRVALTQAQTLHVYRQLSGQVQSEDLHDGSGLVQFGQPVACGMRDGVKVSALRLCISARQVSDAAVSRTVSGIVAQAMVALDQAVRLI